MSSGPRKDQGNEIITARLTPATTRILLTEDSTFVADKLNEALIDRGFNVKVAKTGNEALAIAKNWKPHFILYDLMMPDVPGPAMLKQLKADDLLGDDKSRVFMMSAHNSTANVKECLKLGASDYLVKPVRPEDLMGRLVLHMQTKRTVAETRAGDTSVQGNALHYMHLTELLLRESLKTASQADVLYNLVGMLSLALGAVRVSVVQADLEKGQGTVRASSDKKDIDGLVLDLVKYPEIVFVLRSEKTLALDNLKGDQTMAAVAQQTKSISFNAMIVCPVRFGGETWGVVSVRLPDTKTTLSDFEIRFAQLTTHVGANVVLRHRLMAAAAPAAPAGGGSASGTNKVPPKVA